MRASAAPRQGFVGRAQDLAQLRQALHEATTGRGLVALVGGEPGVGKTRLAEEVADAARAAGVQVLWVSCWSRAPAFWPWTQLGRQLLRGAEREPGDFGVVGDDLAPLLPELTEASRPESDPEQARFQVFEAATTLLREASVARPLLVVIDDLHWADADSLRLLSFVAREMHGIRALVLGTFRDVEVDGEHPLAAVLDELTSEHRRLALRGLGPAELAELLIGLTHATLSPQLLDAVHRQTGGNPLFVREAVRLLDGQGELGPVGLREIPHGVRSVIDRRLAALTSPCAELLETAALIGDEFDEHLLTAATGGDAVRVHELLAEAAAARLVEAPAGHDRHRFVHALVREVLETRASPQRRREGHRMLGAALEARGDAEMAVLAHHFRAAGVADKALDYAAAAGDRAFARRAYEDAVGHFTLALALPGLSASRRCELLLGLGRARVVAGQVTPALADLHQAGMLAKQCGAHTVLAEAALCYGAGPWVLLADERGSELLSDALQALDQQDSPVRARLLAKLATAQLYTTDLQRRRDLAAQAEAMARRLGDPGTLAAVLYERHLAARDGPDAQVRLNLATEVVRLARENGDDRLALDGRALRAGDLLELGDLQGFEREVATCEREVTAQRLPRLRCLVLMLRSSQAGIAGRFVDGERLADEARRLGERLGAQEMHFSYVVMMTSHRLSMGRLGESVGELRELALRKPAISALRSGLAAALCEAGRSDEARSEFDRLAANGFTDLPRNPSWQPMAMLLALSCTALGDASRAAVLYDLAAPYARRHTQLGVAGFGYIGPVSYYLGLLAGTLGRWDEAVGHLDDAITEATRLGAAPFVAHARYQHARALLARGDPGEIEQARAEHAAAVATAEGLGIRFHRCAEPPSSAAVQTPAQAVLRPEGDYWTVRYTGPSFRIRHRAGLGYLARLLAEPHREWHATDLAGVPDRGDAGPVLDTQAKSAYKTRLSELAAELTEAEDWADDERATRCRVEIDQLTDQLVGAVGLGGRDRRAASEAERARVRVTKALKATIRNLARHDPALGEHLTRTIRTGNFCVYTGERTWTSHL